jgi:aryl-alcohol dehydrogenase-like predicted oxidoreductase
VFPYDHVIDSTNTTLRNLGVDALDLQQLHVWDDAWTTAEGWRRAVDDLKRSGKIRAFGISVNRWEPHNVLRALETGLVDAVQVVYNLFDRSAEDVLFPTCQRDGIAVIARVPFDEGSLTGTLRADSRWPEADWRNTYFSPAHLAETLPRVDAVRRDADAEGMSLPELALRFILAHPAVTTTIPGMRRPRHVEANLGVSDRPSLPAESVRRLRAHRWNRVPDDRP